MDQVTACPKCHKKYRVASQNVGKPMKCPACQATFRVVAHPASAQPARPQGSAAKPAAQAPAPVPQIGPVASAADWKSVGLEGPLAPTPALFPQSVSYNADPLANHVVMDPGFVQVDIEAVRAARVAKEKKRLGADPTRTSSSLANADEEERLKAEKRRKGYLSTETLFSLDGRINRKKWWLSSLLFGLIIMLALFAVAGIYVVFLDFAGAKVWGRKTSWGVSSLALSTGLLIPLYVVGGLANLLSAYVGICLGVKRYHDLGRSGWRYALVFIPLVGAIWVLVECGFMRGEQGRNKYGPDPLLPGGDSQDVADL